MPARHARPALVRQGAAPGARAEAARRPPPATIPWRTGRPAGSSGRREAPAARRWPPRRTMRMWSTPSAPGGAGARGTGLPRRRWIRADACWRRTRFRAAPRGAGHLAIRHDIGAKTCPGGAPPRPPPARTAAWPPARGPAGGRPARRRRPHPWHLPGRAGVRMRHRTCHRAAPGRRLMRVRYVCQPDANDRAHPVFVGQQLMLFARIPDGHLLSIGGSLGGEAVRAVR